MASSHRSHFADPHKLSRVEYSGRAAHVCDVCGLKLAGTVGYRCEACDFDVHEVCADHFTETVSFFAHPWHPLKLSRVPVSTSDSVGWKCNLCMEVCPPGSLLYRCVGCMFDVHPLCTMLPQKIRSPLHPEHDLHMVPSPGGCRACSEVFPIWHYVCGGSCLFKLHISCVTGEPSGAEQGSAAQQGHSSSSGKPQQGSTSTASQTTSGSESVVVKRSRRTRVAKFLLKQAFFLAIDATTGGLASPLIEILAEAMV